MIYTADIFFNIHSVHLISFVLDSPSCEERKANEKFKIKLYICLPLESNQHPSLPTWRLRSFGRADSQQNVVKTPTPLWNGNKINTNVKACMKFIMFWFVHTKFFKGLPGCFFTRTSLLKSSNNLDPMCNNVNIKSS